MCVCTAQIAQQLYKTHLAPLKAMHSDSSLVASIKTHQASTVTVLVAGLTL